MLISVITPEHSKGNIPFLRELYQSLLDQTYPHWEWVLFLNNGMTSNDLPREFASDNRIVTVEGDRPMANIGEIKHEAFHRASGEIIVEADHDDILTEDCLQEIYNVFSKQPNVGFVYSDCAVLHMQDQFKPYDPAWGWTHRMFNWKGKQLYAMNSFAPTSHAMSFVWYAPDHVRAWRASTYREIGGHNKDLSICDDHELVIRTYLTTDVVHIPRVLYIYRITGDNTWLERNQQIQTKTVELFHQYGQRLAERDADIRNLLKVDIGGGLNPYPGYTTIDLRPGSDYVHDLNDGIPLPDNSVGVLHASHILEHLQDKTKIMSEIHRVLAHGGWAFIEVPSTDGRGAFQDPTHVSYWNENSFLYYTQKYLADFIDNSTVRFQEFRRETWFPNQWLKNLNVCVTTAWLVAVKPGGQRLPHSLTI